MERELPAKSEVRRADSSDASQIATVLHQAFVEYKSIYTPQGFAATTPTVGAILSRMNEGPFWVTLLDGVIVGTASVVKKEDSLYIRGMAVLPERRGGRLGELLLTRIQEYAVERGCKRLFLSTTPFLDRAIRLYERVGFTRTEEGPRDLFGTPLFTMEKKIVRSDEC
jgi:putative acetyltransferase